MDTETINNIKNVFKNHIIKIYSPEQKDYCSYKFIDKNRQEFCFDVINNDEFIKFYKKNRHYALIEMKSQTYRFFVDFDIFYNNENEIPELKDILHKKLNETLYAIYQKKFQTIWVKRQYFSQIKQLNKLGIHVYVPELIVNNTISRIIRHIFCEYNSKFMKIMDPSVYTIYTGLYYFYSIRKNGEYTLDTNNNIIDYDFQLRTKLPETQLNPISPQYINHLIDVFNNDTCPRY